MLRSPGGGAGAMQGGGGRFIPVRPGAGPRSPGLPGVGEHREEVFPISPQALFPADAPGLSSEFGGLSLDLGGQASEFGGLSLDLGDEEEPDQHETWALSSDGTLQHRDSGILIGELGLRHGSKIDFQIDPTHIEVDQTNIIGRGAGGVVAKGVHKPTGTLLAVKVVRVEDKNKRAQLLNDLHTLLSISTSSFLIQMYAAYIHKETSCVHVALELMDYGSLADVKHNVMGSIPESILALVLTQVLEGLKALHLAYVVHRDVKLGNILVNSKGSVKVTDFGISKRLSDVAELCDTFVGTTTHMSPERVLGKDYSFAADIWSFGLVVYELAVGKYPYGKIQSFPVIFDHLTNKPEPRLPPGKFSPALCDFTAGCLQRKPEKRKTAIQLQAHAFILGSLFQVTQAELCAWLRNVMRTPISPRQDEGA